jgi:hypothetical protein
MPPLVQQHSGNQKRREWVSPPPPQERIDEEAEEGDRSEKSSHCGQDAIIKQRDGCRPKTRQNRTGSSNDIPPQRQILKA